MKRITPVILCGGSGTRLWPRSRKDRPKPFLPLVGQRTLFQAALDRCADSARFNPPLVVTGAAHRDLVEAQAGPGTGVIVEPAGRNTAPAIALAAHRLAPDEVMLVCPSDHHIADVPAFLDGVARAARLAAAGWLVAFGIRPERAETGYGYIKRGEPIEGGYRIAHFVEKPSRERAELFLADGGFSWNGGLFAFTAGAFLAELERQRPALALAVAAAVAQGTDEGARFHPEAGAFATITAESVDYAVMEGARQAAMVPVDMGWSDIGSWQALQAVRGHDAFGNHSTGSAELVDCRGVMTDSDGPRVSVIGLDNVIVVVDAGEVLVLNADAAQTVGRLDGARRQ